MKNFNKLLEDIYASQYKIKKVHTQNPTTGEWEWHDNKVRTKRINFKNSKMAGEPAQKDDKDMKEEKTTGATKLVHTRTGADGAKYHIMQDSPYDYSVHKEHKGKTTHIDTYSSLHRAKSVLDNEVKEEVQIDEAGYGRNRGYAHGFASPHAPSLGGRREREDDEGWDREPQHKPADAPHAVHIDGKKWKSFGSKSHAQNVANKIKGATVHKEEINMTIDEQINEVLSKDATAGDWIHDFVHSDNPKFADKSKDKRKEMALAAYYAKQQNEEVKDEYARKVDKHLKNKYAPVAPVPDKKFIKGTPENLALKASRKPINGHPTNVKEGTMKSFREVMQSLQEANHREFATQGLMHPDMAKHMVTGHEFDFYHPKTGDKTSGIVKHKSDSEVHIKAHKDGILGAGDVHKFTVSSKMNEEVEQIDELDKSTLKSYINKNIKSGRADDGGKGDTGLYRATNKVAGKLKTGTLDNKVKTLGNTSSNAHKNPYEYDASRSELKNRGVHHFAGRRTRTEELNMEAKDEREYGYEGDMAMTQLKTMCRHAEEFMGMLKPDTDLPEWVQSKITLATDYIQTAHDYMSSEMNEELKGSQHKLDKNKNGKVDAHDFKILRGEQEVNKEEVEYIDELSTDKLKAYKSTAQADRSEYHDSKNSGDKDEAEYAKKKIMKRSSGIADANKRLNKEEVETRTVSFKDFINEIKMADLPKRTVKGSSYGAQYHDPEGDDAFERKPKQVAKPEPEVKRGRGRPAGSKSGANQKVTSGTKRSGVDYSGYKLHLPNSNR